MWTAVIPVSSPLINLVENCLFWRLGSEDESLILGETEPGRLDLGELGTAESVGDIQRKGGYMEVDGVSNSRAPWVQLPGYCQSGSRAPSSRWEDPFLGKFTRPQERAGPRVWNTQLEQPPCLESEAPSEPILSAHQQKSHPVTWEEVPSVGTAISKCEPQRPSQTRRKNNSRFFFYFIAIKVFQMWA